MIANAIPKVFYWLLGRKSLPPNQEILLTESHIFILMVHFLYKVNKQDISFGDAGRQILLSFDQAPASCCHVVSLYAKLTDADCSFMMH